MIDVMIVPANEVVKVWGAVEPLISSAIKRWLPVMKSVHVYERIVSNEAQLWIAYDNEKQILHGAVVTEILDYPDARILNVFLLGGKDIKTWREPIAKAVEEFAMQEKCLYLQSKGRKGWQTIFPEMMETAVVLNKALVY